MNAYTWTPRMRIHKKNGTWILDTGYGAAKLPHDTWDQARRHAIFIHQVREEV